MKLVDGAVEASYEHEALIIEEMISYARQGNEVMLLGSGNSMFPLMRNGRDYAILSAVEDYSKLKRGDIILYFSNGHFVLHRIHHINENGYYMIGDGNFNVEPPLSADHIFLKADRIKRGNRVIDMSNGLMILYGRIWLGLLPVRPLIFNIINILRHTRNFLRKDKSNED